jgi:AbrB family looped-hinge helix DNA binding protein
MKHAISSKLTAKCQTTIPEKIRKILDLHPGDSVTFEVAGEIFLRKKIEAISKKKTRGEITPGLIFLAI